MKLSGLHPNTEYHFEVLQFASHLQNKNGKLTILPENLEFVVSEQYKSDDPISHAGDYLSDRLGWCPKSILKANYVFFF